MTASAWRLVLFALPVVLSVGVALPAVQFAAPFAAFAAAADDDDDDDDDGDRDECDEDDDSSDDDCEDPIDGVTHAFETLNAVLTGLDLATGGLAALTANDSSFLGKLTGGLEFLAGSYGALHALTGKSRHSKLMRLFTAATGVTTSLENTANNVKKVRENLAAETPPAEGAPPTPGTASTGPASAASGPQRPARKPVRSQAPAPEPAPARIAAQSGASVVVVARGMADGIYRLNCPEQGRCFLVPLGGGLPAEAAVGAFQTACREVYVRTTRGRAAPAWWTNTVCAPPSTPISAEHAALLGRGRALEALLKGDAFWTACTDAAPGEYWEACGSQRTADGAPTYGAPVWAATDSPADARRLGAELGAAFGSRP